MKDFKKFCQKRWVLHYYEPSPVNLGGSSVSNLWLRAVLALLHCSSCQIGFGFRLGQMWRPGHATMDVYSTG